MQVKEIIKQGNVGEIKEYEVYVDAVTENNIPYQKKQITLGKEMVINMRDEALTQFYYFQEILNLIEAEENR